MSRSDFLDLSRRIALRPKEAAAALGVSERTLRQMLPEMPHTRRGGVVLIPVRALVQWLEGEAAAQRSRTEATTEEVIRSLAR